MTDDKKKETLAQETDDAKKADEKLSEDEAGAVAGGEYMPNNPDEARPYHCGFGSMSF